MQEKIFKEIDQLQQEINAQRPLDAGFLKQIREYYKIGLTFSSNALVAKAVRETQKDHLRLFIR